MFNWFKKKKEEPAQINYKLVDVTVEADELIGEVMLHLIDGTIVKYTKPGFWNFSYDYINLSTGKDRSYYESPKGLTGYTSNVYYNKPQIESYNYFNPKQLIEYTNTDNINVTVNPEHIIQSSINIKSTGKKTNSIYKKVEKI